MAVQFADRISRQRTLARSQLDLCDLGRAAWTLSHPRNSATESLECTSSATSIPAADVGYPRCAAYHRAGACLFCLDIFQGRLSGLCGIDRNKTIGRFIRRRRMDQVVTRAVGKL